MQHARDAGRWTLRVYSWSAPTLSLGRHQTARGGYDRDRLRSAGVDVVRRPTGGRAILHHREVTYSVTAPVSDAGDLRESYSRINRLLVAGLRALGVSAAVSAGTSASLDGARLPGLLPCFDHPSPGEITLAGRKLAGSAQWRSDGALLQHGSILVDDDQMRLTSFLSTAGSVIPTPATLAGALGRAPEVGEVAEALFAAVVTLEDPDAVPLCLEAPLIERSRALRERYLDDGWTWRR